MYTIGITGGIGCGKSAVSALISEKGYKVIDADEISRAMTSGDGQLFAELTGTFGDEVLGEEGKLDRKKLASVVFSDEEKKSLLQSIVTDRVIEEIKKKKSEAHTDGTRVLFIDAPLLFECGAENMCDCVWLVTAEDDIRIKRVMLRDGATRAEVEARIRNQMSQSDKMKLADEVINNSGRPGDLRIQVEKLLEKYAEL